MKILIKLEQTAISVFAIFLYSRESFSGIFFVLLFLTPDIGMLGYLFNKKVGAITYNLLHHQGLIFVFLILGIYSETNLITQISLIFLAHSSFDRIFGYGLKTFQGFKETHLGTIGNK